MNKVSDYEYKIEVMVGEIDRLNAIIENKNKDIQNLQAKNIEG